MEKMPNTQNSETKKTNEYIIHRPPVNNRREQTYREAMNQLGRRVIALLETKPTDEAIKKATQKG